MVGVPAAFAGPSEIVVVAAALVPIAGAAPVDLVVVDVVQAPGGHERAAGEDGRLDPRRLEEGARPAMTEQPAPFFPIVADRELVGPETFSTGAIFAYQARNVLLQPPQPVPRV